MRVRSAAGGLRRLLYLLDVVVCVASVVVVRNRGRAVRGAVVGCATLPHPPGSGSISLLTVQSQIQGYEIRVAPVLLSYLSNQPKVRGRHGAAPAAGPGSA